MDTAAASRVRLPKTQRLAVSRKSQKIPLLELLHLWSVPTAGLLRQGLTSNRMQESTFNFIHYQLIFGDIRTQQIIPALINTEFQLKQGSQARLQKKCFWEELQPNPEYPHFYYPQPRLLKQDDITY